VCHISSLHELTDVQIDWDAVGGAMDLKKGAVSKRWSRLKMSMEKGETPSGSAYKFLWICLKHSTRDKVSMILRRQLYLTDHKPGHELAGDRREVRYDGWRRFKALLPHETSF
jgi:hypothetical protein